MAKTSMIPSTYLVDEEIKNKALIIAKKKGTTLSKLVGRYVTDYVGKNISVLTEKQKPYRI